MVFHFEPSSDLTRVKPQLSLFKKYLFTFSTLWLPFGSHVKVTLAPGRNRETSWQFTWADTLCEFLHPHLPWNLDFFPRWGGCKKKKQGEERKRPDHHKMLLCFPIQMSEWWMLLVWHSPLPLDKSLQFTSSFPCAKPYTHAHHFSLLPG